MNKLKIGIFFGGPSREREISFAGGRTVYDNLDKSLFEPVPLFVDAFGDLIQLDWQYLYKGTIRDFYPPVSAMPDSPNGFQIYEESLTDVDAIQQMADEVGQRVDWTELAERIDVAFLALHGTFGEDGQIQGMLEGLGIPYTGSGIRTCSIGMDKAFQKKMMEAAGFATPEVMVLTKQDWLAADVSILYEEATAKIGFPMVIRPANQGSSIGVSIINEDRGFDGFFEAMNAALFRQFIDGAQWLSLAHEDKLAKIRSISDLREGAGLPLDVEGTTIHHPEALLEYLDQRFQSDHSGVFLEGHHTEQTIVLESFIRGKEFSCIVIRQEDGSVVALPPTEIIKGDQLFDYRSKYLPGLSRKETPIKLPTIQIEAIQKECKRLFEFLGFNVYARIDGFITREETIFLNDPNTTSGMLPSSFFFHQAAEIGLHPSQFISFIIRASLQERIQTSLRQNHWEDLLSRLDQLMEKAQSNQESRRKVAVILGGYSFERHISVESGRNIFEKLASSGKYEVIPIFLTGDGTAHQLFQLPINLLLKDNADDIRDKALHPNRHPLLDQIRTDCALTTKRFASSDVVFEAQQLTYAELAQKVDGVFIALHGRPGEDGTVQRELLQHGIAFNGSPPHSSAITIDKYETLQALKKEGFIVAHQLLVHQADYEQDANTLLERIEYQYPYPFVAKPVDDGCSSAVAILKNRAQLSAYLETIFREGEAIDESCASTLGIRPNDEFPNKKTVLLENKIDAAGASQFMETTTGLMTTRDVDGQIQYTIFEPSEALADGEVLSLEEKFLAGQGQNITPARLGRTKEDYQQIVAQHKADLIRAAKILDIQGYARIDAFVRVYDDLRTETIIIEVNSLPGMTPATCIFHQAALEDMKPFDFIDAILNYGFRTQAARI